MLVDKDISSADVQAILAAHLHQTADRRQNIRLCDVRKSNNSADVSNYTSRMPGCLDPDGIYGPRLGGSAAREWILPISIDVRAFGHRYAETVLWNVYENEINPLEFADSICADMNLPSAVIAPIGHAIAQQLLLFQKSFSESSTDATHLTSDTNSLHSFDLPPWAPESIHGADPWSLLSQRINSERINDSSVAGESASVGDQGMPHGDDNTVSSLNKTSAAYEAPDTVHMAIHFGDAHYEDVVKWDISAVPTNSGQTVRYRFLELEANGTMQTRTKSFRTWQRNINDPAIFAEKTAHELGLPLQYVPSIAAALHDHVNRRLNGRARKVNESKTVSSWHSPRTNLPSFTRETMGDGVSDVLNACAASSPFTEYNEPMMARESRALLAAYEHFLSKDGRSCLPLDHTGKSISISEQNNPEIAHGEKSVETGSNERSLAMHVQSVLGVPAVQERVLAENSRLMEWSQNELAQSMDLPDDHSVTVIRTASKAKEYLEVRDAKRDVENSRAKRQRVSTVDVASTRIGTILLPSHFTSFAELPATLPSHRFALDGANISRVQLAQRWGGDRAGMSAAAGCGYGDVMALSQIAQAAEVDTKRIAMNFTKSQRQLRISDPLYNSALLGYGAQRDSPAGFRLPIADDHDLKQQVLNAWTKYRQTEAAMLLHTSSRSQILPASRAASRLAMGAAPFALMGAGSVPASLVRALKFNKEIPLCFLPPATVEQGFGIPLPGGRIVTSQGFYERSRAQDSPNQVPWSEYMRRLVRRRFRRYLRALSAVERQVAGIKRKREDPEIALDSSQNQSNDRNTADMSDVQISGSAQDGSNVSDHVTAEAADAVAGLAALASGFVETSATSATTMTSASSTSETSTSTEEASSATTTPVSKSMDAAMARAVAKTLQEVDERKRLTTERKERKDAANRPIKSSSTSRDTTSSNRSDTLQTAKEWLDDSDDEDSTALDEKVSLDSALVDERQARPPNKLLVPPANIVVAGSTLNPAYMAVKVVSKKAGVRLGALNAEPKLIGGLATRQAVPGKDTNSLLLQQRQEQRTEVAEADMTDTSGRSSTSAAVFGSSFSPRAS